MSKTITKIAQEIGICVGLLFSRNALGLWAFITVYVLFFKGN